MPLECGTNSSPDRSGGTPVRINGIEAARYLVTELAPERALGKAIAAHGPEILIA